MRPPTERVLLAGMASEDAEPYRDALSRYGFDPTVVTDPEHATALVEEERFGAVVVTHPLPPGVLGGLLSVLRARGAVNAGTGLVLLAPSDGLRAASSLVGRGVTRALSRSEDPVVLALVVQRIVELGSPTVERVPASHEVTLGPDGTTYRTADLSVFGMMVASESPPPIGSTHRFELTLPSGTIGGTLRVVRHASVARDGNAGFGARFVNLEGDGQRRLREFIGSVVDDADDASDATPAAG